MVHLYVTVKLVSLCELLSDPVFQYIVTLSLLCINFLQLLNNKSQLFQILNLIVIAIITNAINPTYGVYVSMSNLL